VAAHLHYPTLGVVPEPNIESFLRFVMEDVVERYPSTLLP
jgi:hypothetical protein